jgi:hypothetical protein
VKWSNFAIFGIGDAVAITAPPFADIIPRSAWHGVLSRGLSGRIGLIAQVNFGYRPIFRTDDEKISLLPPWPRLS